MDCAHFTIKFNKLAITASGENVIESLWRHWHYNIYSLYHTWTSWFIPPYSVWNVGVVMEMHLN